MKKTNRIIARFMGMKPYYKNQLNGFWTNTIKAHDFDTVMELKFDKSWDWLMEVVEYIENFHSIGGELLEFQVVTYEDEVKIIAKHPNKPWETIVEISADGSGKKANTYKAVVQFIEWYNNQK
jgi:hypothetical protein